MPDQYWHTLDPYVHAMTASCGDHYQGSYQVATGISLVPYRDPMRSCAKEGRVRGPPVQRARDPGRRRWLVSRPEMENHRGPSSLPKARWKMLREYILAMREICLKDEIRSSTASSVTSTPSGRWPKPVQPGGPPVLAGRGRGDAEWAVRPVVTSKLLR